MSKLPLQWATFTRRRTKYVTHILSQYGPVAVIAPDQIHTTDDASMKAIYDKTSLKTSFYSSMGSWKGVTSTLGFVDYPSASPSRTNLIQCFQNRNLAALTENLESHIHSFVQLLDDHASRDEPVDGVVAFRLLALDIVTDVLWGETERLLTRTTEGTPAFLRRFHAFSTWNALKSFIPGLDLVVRWAGPKSWRTLRNDCNDMDVTARQALERWKSSRDEPRRAKDVLSMLQSMNSKTAPAVPTDDMPAYMVEMLAAGSSTTSHTASFVCWLLTRSPEAQDLLHRELAEAMPDLASADISKSTDLPYLDGVIRETMRMYPMIPGPLERHTGRDMEIAQKHVPKGVIASTGAFNQGRLASVYPEPHEWRPERWQSETEAMRLKWIPFGTGCRACPGSNLAMTELKYIIGMIFRRFRAVVPPGREGDTLELADVFAAGSRTGECWLKFVRRDADD